MVTLGVDAHKFTNTAVAVDGNGCEVGTRTVQATSPGHLEMLNWARQWPERAFAVEDCRHVSRRLEIDLVHAGERVVRIPTRLMAGVSRSGRQRGKSDLIDALAVARAALREPLPPLAKVDVPDRDVRLWLDYRADLLCESTRVENRLLGHLHELEPEIRFLPRSFRSECQLQAVEAALTRQPGVLAEIAQERMESIRRLSTSIAGLDQELTDLIWPRYSGPAK